MAPLLVTFDPAGSGAATGRTIVNYIWTFGDGTAPVSTGMKVAQTHRFVTSLPSQVFTVTLIVVDDQGDDELGVAHGDGPELHSRGGVRDLRHPT